MGGGDLFKYAGVDVGLGRVMMSWRSLRRLFMLTPLGLVLSDYLVFCVLRFAFGEKWHFIEIFIQPIGP